MRGYYYFTPGGRKELLVPYNFIVREYDQQAEFDFHANHIKERSLSFFKRRNLVVGKMVDEFEIDDSLLTKFRDDCFNDNYDDAKLFCIEVFRKVRNKADKDRR